MLVAIFWAATLGLISNKVHARPPIISPTAKWVVDFDRSQCVASRNYGTESKPVLLVLKTPALGAVMQLAILRSGIGGPHAVQVDAKTSIDGAAPVHTSMLARMSGQPGKKLFSINLPLERFNTVRTAKTLTIEAGWELSESFALSDMSSLLKIMERCVADLREVWNIAPDGTSASPLKQPLEGTLTGLFRPEDYPATAIQNLASGSVELVLLIDETGKVADCAVTDTSGIAALDAQSCAIVKERARFRPAIGFDGKPAKSAYRRRIQWKVE